MSLNELERQALGSIEDVLAGSDPRLASMLNIFSRLAAGEEMPVREKIRVRGGRPAAHRPRHARRHPRQRGALPQGRWRYPRLGWQRALLLWMVISSALLAAALVLSTTGHNASCIRTVGTACPSPPSGSGPVALALSRIPLVALAVTGPGMANGLVLPHAIRVAGALWPPARSCPAPGRAAVAPGPHPARRKYL